MFRLVDKFLNQITMYKLVLYFLFILLSAGIVLCFLGILPYDPLFLFLSTLFITAVCWITNTIFSWLFKAPTNSESVYITAWILALLIAPPTSFVDTGFYTLAAVASFFAMTSKYILTIGKKHIFNPAAIAVVITAFIFGQYASWWASTISLAPFVLIGGLLVARKLAHSDLVLSFYAIFLATTLWSHYPSFESLSNNLPNILSDTTLLFPLFFAFVMLTEPLTTPPTRLGRILYGAFVGLLALPTLHIGNIYSTPELALVIGNIFSYLISPKQKLILTLKNRVAYAKDIYHFIFLSDKKLKFEAGQYLEWTLGQKGKVDSRGNRRYFTIASSPTEEEIGLGVKFNSESSTFKQHLLGMKAGEKIVASQLAGDFVLPRNKSKKLVFVAGGIGITPFRSIIKNLIDTKEKRDIILLYSNKLAEDVAYKETFDQALIQFGMKTVYAVTDKNDPLYTGRITEDLIKKEVPDYMERYFYLSGPHNLVTAFEDTLKNLGVHRSHIKTDFFPGFV